MSVQSGRRSLEPFATYDPDTCCWKTWRQSLPLGNLPEPAVNWPASGTWAAGHAYERQTSAPPTVGTAASSLLPTPAAMNPNDGEGLETWQARREREKAKGRNGNGFGTPLSIAVQLLPTPRTSDTNGSGAHGDGGADLRTVVSLLPTPRARDGKGRDPNPRGVDLTAQAAKHATDDQGPGSLDDFNLWTVAVRLNGQPTDQPSPDGEALSDDQLPGQLSLGEADND